MKTFLISLLLGGLATGAFSQADLVHPKINLDKDWRFCRGEIGAPPKVSKTADLTWKWSAAKDLDDAKSRVSSPLDDAKTWVPAATGEDVFKGRVGFAVFKTLLPISTEKSPVLHFDSVDDNADVYLNGKFLLHHEGWDDEFEIPVRGLSKTGNDVVTVIVENTNGPGGIAGKAYLTKSGEIQSSEAATETYNDSGWRKVHLPHDYVIEGKFEETADNSHGSLPKPTAWYRKSFSLPAEAKGKVVSLQFDGVYRNSKVWLNGHLLGTHPSGYTEFRYDISAFAHYGGTNVIAVHVDPTHNEGWWYEGGGIYRHVWLDIANPVSIAPNGVFITTKFEEPKEGVPVESAAVLVSTQLQSSVTKPLAVQLNTKILDEKGISVASASTLLNLPDAFSAPITLKIDAPKLWSLEHPHLYRMLSEIEVDGRVLDRHYTAFGVRTVRFDADKGFFLNGKHVEIQGTCNHQDFAGVGIAVTDSLEMWRVQKLKEMGCNAWRMSHNPPTPSLLEACDRLGMLVMDENRHLGDSDQTLAELSSMVLRDRNHPSVIMWSMCNEQPQAGGEKGGAVFKNMMATVKKLDPTRSVSCAMNSGWYGHGFTDVEDLMGVNYNYEVYEKFHAEHPTMPIFGSETASTVTTRGAYADDKVNTWVTSYNMTDGSWQPAAERPYVAGTFVWTGFDYKGEPSPYSWPCINSNFGIMDMCGFPKDNYYYYQSWWKSKPVVHIMPHWNWPGMEGKDVKVVVFSNAAKVQLYLNGMSLGVQAMPRNGHLEWTVPYSPGALVAKGLDVNDSIVATDEADTVGAPAALRLTSNRSSLRGNGEDLEVVEVDVVDAKGRVCPTAGNLVTFTVSGAAYIAGVGNGNPGDHDLDKARSRRAFNGKCMVVVGTGEKTGAIHLVANSAGLKSISKDFMAK